MTEIKVRDHPQYGYGVTGDSSAHSSAAINKKQDARVKVTNQIQGLTREEQSPSESSVSSSRSRSDRDDKKKRSKRRDSKSKKRSRSKRRSRSRDHRDKRRRRSKSRDRERDRKHHKKDKHRDKYKKDKKRSKRSLEREEKRKQQARLAKARVLAMVGQQEALGGLGEDDLDMPEYETEEQVMQPITTQQIQSQELIQELDSQVQQQLNIQQEPVIQKEVINHSDHAATEFKPQTVSPSDIEKQVKIINKGDQDKSQRLLEKVGQFQEMVEEHCQTQPPKQEEIDFEEGEIVDEPLQSSANIIQIGKNEEKNKRLTKLSAFTVKEDKPLKKVFGHRFTTTQPVVKKEEEEEDPFDAYMKQIEQQAVVQQNVQYPGEAMFDDISIEEAENQEQANLDNNQVITLDDLMQMQNEQDENETNEDEFHQQFIKELKRKEYQDKLQQESNQIMFEDEGDKYLMDFEKEEEEADSFLEREKKRADKKDLKAFDHTTAEYDKINKNLYIETKEISRMTDKEVIEFRKLYGDIKVRGLKCPKPIQNWYQCGLPDPVLDVIETNNFVRPFPIQCQSIPAIMSGRDVIGIAETGSGKTLAFVLPLIRHIRDQRPLEEGEGPIGLILAPTRELSFQIYKETKTFAKAVGLRVVCVHGGTNVASQLSELKRGAEIVVCTPGRMIDVLTTSGGKITNLRRVSYIVLDEADRMLDMGFEPQINRMIQNVRPDKQCVMFSATFPKQIENLARKVLQSPIEIVVGQRGQTCQNVDQFVEVLQLDEKFMRLMELLGEWYDKGSILIFVDKQLEADELFKELYKVGYKVLVLHGGQDQTDREFTIQDFKEGVRSIMVATSVCARGLDIKHLRLVINYVCPNHLEDYVHRVGRTGRAGNKGTAITFINPDECQYAADLIRALENSEKEVPEDLRKLDETYQQKVQEGEMEKRRNAGYMGKGFRFVEEERSKVKEFRKELSKAYGLGVEENEEDENNDIVKSAQQKEEERKKQEEQHLMQLLERDPQARKAAIEAGNQASRSALKQGLSNDEATKVAKEAMMYVLAQYRPSNVTMEKGLESVLQLRDQFVDKENEKNNIFTAEIEINDYPQHVRSKAQNKEYLQSVYEMTGCKVQTKGTYFEFGRKPPTGQRRLHLYIEGSSKQEVANAYKEIKRFLEESALNNAQTYNVNYSGQFGKF